MSDEKIKAPDRIYLHPDDDEGGIEGASWFEGRLSAEDIEYTRSDLVEALRERVKELEGQVKTAYKLIDEGCDPDAGLEWMEIVDKAEGKATP